MDKAKRMQRRLAKERAPRIEVVKEEPKEEPKSKKTTLPLDPVKRNIALLSAKEHAIVRFISNHPVLSRRKLRTASIKYARIMVYQGSGTNMWAVIRPNSTRFYNKGLMREMLKDEEVKKYFPEWVNWK